MFLIFLLMIALITYLFYKLYLRPVRQRKYYAQKLESLGYKVKQLPFQTMGAALYSYLQQCYQNNKDATYGLKIQCQGYDIILSNILTSTQLIFLNMKLAQEYMSTDRYMLFPKLKMTGDIIGATYAKGLILKEGDSWKQRRKLLAKTFNFDYIKELVPAIANLFDKCYDQMQEENQEGNEFKLETFKQGTKLFSRVVISMFVGNEVLDQKIQGNEVQEYALQCAYEVGDLLKNPLVLFLGVKFFNLGLSKSHRSLSRKLKLLRSILRDKIATIRSQFSIMTPQEQQQSKTMIHLLLRQAKEDNQSISDDQIIDEVLIFLLAGSESTSNLFTLYLLSIFKHPEVQDKIREEIKQHIKSEEDFNFETLKQMKYIDWVQNEVLRVYSGAQIIPERMATLDTNIGDIPIRSGTVVTYSPRKSLYDENNFQNPLKFDPERWRNASQQMLNLVMMGFGTGPRNCIGKQLATSETKIAIIKFLQRYKNLKEVSPTREFIYTITYHLKDSTVTFQKL